MDLEKHKKIVKELITDSFPKLKGRKIYLVSINLGQFSGGVFWLLPNIRLIFIHPRTEKWNKKLLTGLLSHELCHFEITQKYGWIKTLYFEALYWITPSIRRKHERETDKLTIKRGYGRELYEVAKRKLYKNKKTMSYYLSPEEIRSYAKEIGCW